MHRQSVLMIGPDPKRSLGGMATVEANMIDNAVLNEAYDIHQYASFIDGSAARRGAFAARQLASFPRRKGRYNIYHIHICSGTSTWRKRLYVKALGEDRSRVVLHVHGGRYHEFFDECSERQQGLIRALYNSVGRVVVLSAEWLEVFRSRDICDPGKIEVVHNAVEIPKVVDPSNISQDILFLGRLDSNKGADVLLRASQEVLKEYPDVKIRLGGDGDIRRFRALAESLGIEASCEFLGWVMPDDKDGVFAKTGIFCLPSRNEGMPMSVLEAMAHGVATVATPVGGVPQIITDGVNGYLAPVDDVPSLATRIKLLLANGDERNRLGRVGRETIVRRFGMDAYASSMIKIYESLGSCEGNAREDHR